jgi:methyltransferase (TIGR00027 family)
MPEAPLIQDVSDTAFMVAAWRGMESERGDALFRDPLAMKLAGEHGKAIVNAIPQHARFGQWLVSVRTHIIDAYIRSALADGVDTVVNLGAGLDTRPYRMDLPASLTWVEVDVAKIIALKQERLRDETPSCRLERVALDLADAAQRQRLFAGIADKAQKALVLTEGVVPYLDTQDAGALADALRAHPSFRYWIVDYMSPQAISHRRRVEHRLKMKNAPFKFDPVDYFTFFKTHGWQVKDIRYIPEEGKRLGRPLPLPLPFKLWIKFTNLFGAKRPEAFGRSVGFVLFEPADL